MPRISLRELKRFAHRVNPEERQGFYGLYLIRPFSLYLTLLALRAGVSANKVTVAQMIVGLAGSMFLASGEDQFVILGLVLLQLGFILDNVDGEVARFKGEVSLTGKYLDTIGHQVVVPFMYFGLGLGTYFRFGTIEAVIFGFLAGLFSLRLDVITMSHEAVELVFSKLNVRFPFYSRFKAGLSPRLYRKKNEESASRIIYAFFAYPAIMNIATVLYLLDLFVLPDRMPAMVPSLIYAFLAIHGTLLPIRRFYTIWRFASAGGPEEKYLELKESGGKADDVSPDSSQDPPSS